MHLTCLTNFDEWTALGDAWEALTAGVPFRGLPWLGSWWRQFGQAREAGAAPRQLAVACVRDSTGALVGAAPWYLERSTTHGRVLRLLGEADVCTDYLSLLHQPGQEREVAAALAERLCARGDVPLAAKTWDLLELAGVDAEDVSIAALAAEMRARGHTVHRENGSNCWRLGLPGGWEDYVRTLSKKRRQEFRRIDRDQLTSGVLTLRVAENARELDEALDVLIDLHQRRRQSLGEPGCFRSPQFTSFVRDAAHGLLGLGQLCLFWLEMAGVPIAAELHLSSEGVLYAYTAGVDPDMLHYEPGKLLHVAIVQWACAQGFRAVDFLRGDERYKGNFGAQPRPSVIWRIVPRRLGPQLRHRAWRAARSVKRWLKARLRPAETALQTKEA